MSEEFSLLLDLATSQGHKTSSLTSAVKAAIAADFKQQYPDQPQGAEVMLDADSGSVRILYQGKDITPKGYAAQAESIARTTILAMLKDAPDKPTAKEEHRSPFFHLAATDLKRPLEKLIFWGYNSLFILAGIVLVVQALTDSPLSRLSELGFLRSGVMLFLIAIPWVSILHVLRGRLSKNPGALSRLFFLFEIPMVVISALVLSMAESASVIHWFFYAMLFVSPAVVYQAVAKDDFDRATSPLLSLVLSTLVVLTLAYLCLLYSFYLLPMVVSFVKFAFEDITSLFFSTSARYSPGILDIVIILISFGFKALLSGIGLALIMVPFVLFYLVYRYHMETRTSYVDMHTEKSAWQLIGGIALAYMFLVGGSSLLSSKQDVLDRLDSYAQATTYEEKAELARELQPQEQTLKSLISNRRLHSTGIWTRNSRDLERSYTRELGLDPMITKIIQQTFLTIAHPFVNQQPQISSMATQSFYDLFGYYSNQEKPADVVPTTNVMLAYRRVTAVPAEAGAVASVTVDESYTNKTNAQQEVIYEFSLPQDAVVTDLSLGPDLEYSGLIAPRGAAQATYEQQLQQRRDPALLEQLSPTSYRLRVFPVPGKNDRTTLQGQNQRVAFSYITPLGPKGYALPVYASASNIEVNERNIDYTLAGKNVSVSDDATYLATADTPNFCDTPASSVSLPDGTRFTLSRLDTASHVGLSFVCDQGDMGYASPELSGQRVALMVETAHSSDERLWFDVVRQVKDAPTLFTDNTFDVYFYNSVLSQPRQLNAENAPDMEPVYFSQTGKSQLLASIGGGYDAVVLLGNDSTTLPAQLPSNLTGPIYWIFSQEKAPTFSQTLSTQVLETGGTVVVDLGEALNHLAASQQIGSRESVLSVSPYYVTTLEPGSELARAMLTESAIDTRLEYLQSTSLASASAELGPVMAHNFVTHLTGSGLANTNNLPLMDAMDTFARENRVVTPFSSLLALVNQQQLDELARQLTRTNRYQERPITENQSRNVQPVPQPIMFEEPMFFESTGPSLFGADLLMPSAQFEGGLSSGDMIGGSVGNTVIGAAPVGYSSGGFLTGVFGLGGIVGLIVWPTVIILIVGTGSVLYTAFRKQRSS